MVVKSNHVIYLNMAASSQPAGGIASSSPSTDAATCQGKSDGGENVPELSLVDFCAQLDDYTPTVRTKKTPFEDDSIVAIVARIMGWL